MQCFRDPACFHLWLYYPWAFPLHLLNPITGQGRRQNVEDHVRGFQKPGFEVSYVIPTKLHWLEFNPMALPNNREEWEVQFQPCTHEEKEQGLDEHIALFCLSLIRVIWEIVQPIQLFISSICSRFNYLPNVSSTERIRLYYISLGCFPSPFLCLTSTSGTHRYHLAQQATDQIVQTENSWPRKWPSFH